MRARVGSRVLGALTIAAAQRFGSDTFMIEDDTGIRELRMARVGDIVVIHHPANATGPRRINCYFVEVEDAAALGADGRSSRSIRSASCTCCSGATTPRHLTCICS